MTLRRLAELADSGAFLRRHVGTCTSDEATMCAALGVASPSELLERSLPPGLRTSRPYRLPAPVDEASALAELARLAERNERWTSLVGMGYHACVTPQVIQRNVLENPAWYTAYTPYQPEISQGRLEALLNFQTVVSDLTALELANASLLDEPTAAAEALSMCHAAAQHGGAYFVDEGCHPQTIEVVRTRAAARGIPVVVGDPLDGLADAAHGAGPLAGVLVQYPSTIGEVRDLSAICDQAHRAGALVVVAADLLALTLLRPPGELGADIAVGSTQRFGVPLWFGGPHAAYIAARPSLQRLLPGRIVGVSVDADGRPALRLALQTREQHIRRERATSNICTSEALLAVVAGFYAAYHGPDGLRAIAERVHRLTVLLAEGVRRAGLEVVTARYFDTIVLRTAERTDELLAAAAALRINLRRVDDAHLGISLDETTTAETVELLYSVFGCGETARELDAVATSPLGDDLLRTSAYLGHPTFSRYRSETAMLRYMRSLADKDIALDRSMIPLGSCTMKLNAAVEMAPVSWAGFADVHPYAPLEQAQGYLELIGQLEAWLCDLTGYDACSVQPNAGSQGELAGLLAIRAYHESQGEPGRRVCLVPSSAHGTNAASAAMAGLEVVVVACDDHGNVDPVALSAKLVENRGTVAALMITYPSTHGVYEEGVRELCALVHDAGGQVYIDGANLNALVGVVRLAELGGDVSHVNLHKTFCIPHGGGGPGVGPVAAKAHLARFLPGSATVPDARPGATGGAVAGSPFGSAGVLPIAWAYLRLLGAEGMAAATTRAVLAANYVAERLRGSFPVLYSGRGGTVAHECILDLRDVTQRTGVTAEDVAKRLVDYGIHAPTMSFPVAGTLMVEPTESEPKAELDRFCDAMIAIRSEIDEIGAGRMPLAASPLRRAPHTDQACASSTWDRPYRREVGAVLGATGGASKYWPPVGRVDNAYGDRNVFCTCPPLVEEATPQRSGGVPSGPGRVEDASRIRSTTATSRS